MHVDLPSSGAVTFLFTDIEGSTPLWEQQPEAMKIALARHDTLLHDIVVSHAGHLVKTTGDGAYAVFVSAGDAVTAAVAIQRAFLTERHDTDPGLPPLPSLRVRIGLHVGEAELRDGDYHGPAVNRAARVMSSGHGGQILISAAVASLAVDGLPADVSFRDLGEHVLRGVSRPIRLYQVVASGLPADFPALKTASARPVRLPQNLTAFIGRWDEVEDVLNLLLESDSRLVTLLGPGGMGKTRLAIQAAASLVEHEPDLFRDGIFFVPMAPILTADRMVAAIAEAVDLRFDSGVQEARQQLLDFLSVRNVLLIVDNMEHLLPGGGEQLLADILVSAPGTRLLVTSRAKLAILGERLYPLAGMRAPRPEIASEWVDPQREAEAYSALRLFAAAAARQIPHFQLTRDNIQAVVRICGRVQGMPLAIELAAGWMDVLSPAEIASEIERSLDLLATELNGVPDRQRSLRAVFESSWQLLDERERGMVATLSVFRAPFTREAAESVTGAGLRDLLTLSSRSWLQRIEQVAMTTDFQFHELLRQYAEEILEADAGAAAAVRGRYARYFASWVASTAPRLLGHEQQQMIQAYSAAYPHLQASWLALATEGRVDHLVETMLYPLVRFSMMHAVVIEIRDMLLQTTAAFRRSMARGSETDRAILASLLVAASHSVLGVHDTSSQMEEAWEISRQLEEPESLLGIWYVLLLRWRSTMEPVAAERLRALAEGWDDPERFRWAPVAWESMGGLLFQTAVERDHLKESVLWYRRALEHWERHGDLWSQANTSYALGMALASLGDADEADRLMVRAVTIYEMLEDWHNAIWTLRARGEFYLGIGRPDLFLASFEEPIALARAKGAGPIQALTIGRLSTETARYGSAEEALALRRQSMAITRASRFTSNEPWELWELGEVYRVAGQPGEAAHAFEQARAGFQAQDNRFGLAYWERGLGDLALTAGRFEEALGHFERSYQLMRGRPLEVWSQAYVVCGASRACIAFEHLEEGLSWLREGILIVTKPYLSMLRSHYLFAAAELAWAAGRAGLSAALCGRVTSDPLTWNETRGLASRLLEKVHAASGDEAKTAEANGRDLDADALLAAIARLSVDEVSSWLDAVELLVADPPTAVMWRP